MNSRMCLVFCLLTLLVIPLAAQQDQGMITGTVKDSTGAVIPGAEVTARDVNTNLSHSATCNVSGVYVIGPIKIGLYEVSVETAGFKKAVRGGIELHANDRIGLDFEMELGDIVEVVEVTGATPILQTEQSSLSHVVERRDIEQLPLNTRNYQTLALMSAGVAPEIGGRDLGPTMEGGHTKSGFVAHGQPALQNNYVLDGIDNNNTIMGQQDRKSQAVIPSLDAVQEFKVQTSNYSAEFGRNAGAVVNITIKGGTNDLHGSAYDFLRNDVFDARPTFSYSDRTGDGKADPEVLRQNQFGVTMGGPIIKNKMFFFGSYEGWRIRRARTARATIPTALERSGDFSQTVNLDALMDPAAGAPFPGNKIPQDRMDPVALKIIDLYPQPNFKDPITRTNFVSGPPNTIDRNQYDVRIDHSFSGKDSIFGRYSYYTFDRLIGGPWTGIADSGDLHDNWGQHLTISETHLFTPSLVNEFRFGYKYLKPNRRSPSNTELADANASVGLTGVTIPDRAPVMGMSRIQFGGSLGFAQLGGNYFNPNLKDMGTYQFVDNLNWTKGNHTLKFGADIRFEFSNIFGGKWARGGYIFDGRYTNVSLGDAFLGWAYRTQESRLDLAEYRFPSYMFYVQDDWKVTPTFTLNLGIRYELRPPWIEKDGRYNFVNFDSTSSEFGNVIMADPDGSIKERALSNFDRNNIGPRIGFAWQPARNWTIRSGFGLFWGGQMGLGASARPSGNFPFSSTVDARGTNSAPSGLIRDGIPSGFLGEPATVTHVTDFPNNSSVDVYDFNDPLPQTAQWNFTVQRRLAQNLSLEVAYVGSATQGIDGTYNINDGGPGDPNTITARRLFTGLNSLSFRTPWGHASYHGMDVNLRKRFAEGFTFTVGYTWSHSISQLGEQFVGGDGTGTQDPTCFSCDRGNASNDVRHRFVGSYIYELPFGKGRRFLNQGGVVDHVLGGWQLTGMITSQTGQYFRVTYSKKNKFLGTTQGEWRADVAGDWKLDKPTADLWFNPDAFVKPCSPDDSVWTNCHQGNLGRNTIQEDGIINWDFGLGKTWRLTERFRLQYRAEAFNLTNSPSLGTPSRGMDGATPGVIRGTHSTERQIQMGLRLTW